MSLRLLCALVALAAAAPTRAAAQTDVEARGGLTVGSHTATAAALELHPAVSLEALVLHEVRPGWRLLGGFARTAFGCQDGFCRERRPTITGNHAVLGGERSWGRPWIRVAILYGSTRVGSEGVAPDAGPGVLGAAGILLGRGRIRVLPGVSYRWLSAGTRSDPGHAVALALDVGLAVRVEGTPASTGVGSPATFRVRSRRQRDGP